MVFYMQAQAAAKASRAQLATADAAADASDAARQRLQQELQAAQKEAAAAEAAAAAAREDTAAARKALLGLTAEVEQQRLDGAVDDLRWPDRCKCFLEAVLHLQHRKTTQGVRTSRDNIAKITTS